MAFRRRHKRTLDNVWYIAGSCTLFFLVGNLVMFQSYHGFVENSDKRKQKPNDIEDTYNSDHSVFVRELSNELLGASIGNSENSQYFVFEGRMRKLMGNTRDSTHPGIRLTVPHLALGPDGLPSVADNLLDCDHIDNITDQKYIASGWTKAVFKGMYKGRPVAIKTVDAGGQDIKSCMEKMVSFEECYQRASHKIIKEILVLQALPHENVIKVIGFCVPKQRYNGDSNTAVVMVTELGETIDLIKLLQMSWEDRLRISYDVTRLLRFLSSSPLGSISMNDFRRQQFVLVSGQLKLSDVDDVGFGEPSCADDTNCIVHFSSANFTKRMACIEGKCMGYNEQRNLFNAGRHFTTFLLPHGAPVLLRPHIDQLVEAYEQLTMDSVQLVSRLGKVVDMYTRGWYLNRSSPHEQKLEFTVHKESDLPGQFDYRCRFSMSGGGCTLSVFDSLEAESICNLDPDCKGFVMTNQKTWTGRKIVHLKNGMAKPSRNKETDLFVKPP
ncbi:extracellular tyrosine-protein kinase PKDCC-like [Gigantopelta aegis]|uniref:extracellular tyrosine-protein kinase PKDCC-like n=1 Tax=Gigantopelta aegis TaxID=1735272 RepID=UPI001B88966B|nr:extracellular tyrosine-protein kinase PKDCC-like [Gigantopelta aegis]XP_041353613.1 extracellular tyrosine-protein kinase PKDCC-like [Gigantopelta aegis]XP_041353614.1 extracellular tyrosine-protein kinase PKDCC-like [Gigantopelta aegis]XP_041353615.1 extracellular tyrosine-protein kinase PKDCC-like [Gigantopelta aegis]